MEQNYRGTVKKILWDRDGENCGICGESLSLQEAAIDHVQPRSHGGSWEIDNLQLAHGLCNAVKNNRKFDALIARPQKKSVDADGSRIIRIVLSDHLRKKLFNFRKQTGLSLSIIMRSVLLAELENGDPKEMEKLIEKLIALRDKLQRKIDAHGK